MIKVTVRKENVAEEAQRIERYLYSGFDIAGVDVVDDGTDDDRWVNVVIEGDGWNGFTPDALCARLQSGLFAARVE